jgi:ABC-type multidrug transport system ATPase subunit
MIEVEHLAKHFEARVEGRRARVVAVEDIGFTALDGRITALLGPNGAGKTTLLAMALGFSSPSSGSVRVLGQAPGAAVRAGRVNAASPSSFAIFTVPKILTRAL